MSKNFMLPCALGITVYGKLSKKPMIVIGIYIDGDPEQPTTSLRCRDEKHTDRYFELHEIEWKTSELQT